MKNTESSLKNNIYNMTREEKIKMAIIKGITCDINTGKVYGIKGKEITNKTNGYIYISMTQDKKSYSFKAHQLIFYKANNIVVDCIDHINGDKTDNRIENLREVTKQKNAFNTKTKGYSWNKENKKWRSRITLNNKQIHLGLFDKEEDAKQAYLDAKKVYHTI